MATYTEYLNLIKPDTTDYVSVNDLNSNFDTIDSEVGGIKNDRKIITVADWNNFKPTSSTTSSRIYGKSASGSASNTPIAGNSITWYGYCEGVAAYCCQHLTAMYAGTRGNTNRTFIRNCLNGTWTPFVELVERSIPKSVVGSGGTFTFTLPAISHCILTVIGYSTSTMGMALLARGSGTSLLTKWLGDAPSQISVSMDAETGLVTVTNNNTYGTYVSVEQYNNDLIP